MPSLPRYVAERELHGLRATCSFAEDMVSAANGLEMGRVQTAGDTLCACLIEFAIEG
jgi:hypothetical protein